MVPAVIIAAFYVGLIVIAIVGLVTDTGVLIAMLIAQLAAHLVFSAILFRHQKLLEWFRNHIHLIPEKLPPDAPEDLLD